MKRTATIHRFEDPRHRCPNCARRFYDLTSPEHTESGCFLGMLVGVVQDREIVPVTSADVAAFEEVDVLWDSWGGPAADELEDAVGATPAPACRPAGHGAER
jgi:hypothetical protein